MICIAGCITSFLQIEHTSGIALGVFTKQESVFLLCIDVLDKTFLRLDIERDGVVLVGIRSHLEHRLTYQLRHRGICIGRSGVHQITVKTHIDLIALEIHDLVLYMSITEEMSRLRGGVINQGVLSCIFDGSLNSVLPHLVQTVGTNRVIYSLIMTSNGQLQGIHGEGVGNLDGINGISNINDINDICGINAICGINVMSTIGAIESTAPIETINPARHHSDNGEQE